MEKAQEVFEAAVQAEEAGDSDKAIRLYEQSSILAPQHPLPLLRAAILLFTLSKWKQAIRVGRQVTKRQPRADQASTRTNSQWRSTASRILSEHFGFSTKNQYLPN